MLQSSIAIHWQVVRHASLQRSHGQVPLSQQVLRPWPHPGRVQQSHRPVFQQHGAAGSGNTTTPAFRNPVVKTDHALVFFEGSFKNRRAVPKLGENAS